MYIETDNIEIILPIRLQEATTEQNKLQKQLEDSVRELQSQKNGLTNAYAEEKSTLVKVRYIRHSKQSRDFFCMLQINYTLIHYYFLI